MSNAKRKNRLAALIVTAGMLVQPLAGITVFAETDAPVAAKTADDTSYTLNSLEDMKDLMVSITYEQYLSEHENVPAAKNEIMIDVTDYNKELSRGEITVNSSDTVVRDGKEEKAGTVTTTDEGRLVYDVDIPEEAMYNVTVEYFPVEGNGATIERILLIDGRIPFSEARYMNFSRIWKDLEEKGYSRENRTFKVDINNNEMRPVKVEAPEWCTVTLSDSQMFYVEPLKFYFDKGKHTLAFESASEPLKIASIKLHTVKPLLTYEEYLEKYKNVPDAGTDEIIMINAETPLTTSEQVIYAMNDRTSAATVPQAQRRRQVEDAGTVDRVDV